MLNKKKLINYNREIHNRISSAYSSRHDEIFNEIEQERIAKLILYGVSKIKGRQDRKLIQALDFGSGSGNLSRCLMDISDNVYAFDVSDALLKLVESRFNGKVKTEQIEGEGFSKDYLGKFDFVATYSVLHHVPDYLKTVEELCLVTRPGGVVVIDHEVISRYWDYSEAYACYMAEMGQLSAYLHEIGLRQVTGFKTLLQVVVKEIFERFQRRYQIHKTPEFKHEGDIHTNRYDRMNFDSIERKMRQFCDKVERYEYLVCRETSSEAPSWQKWNNKIVDMGCLIGVRK